jgi:hypothetical protein
MAIPSPAPSPNISHPLEPTPFANIPDPSPSSVDPIPNIVIGGDFSEPT